jgi:hypothetical protein
MCIAVRKLCMILSVNYDIDLLAEVDRATSVISGTLTKTFLKNEWEARTYT